MTSAVAFARSLVARKRPEPSYPTLPAVDERGRTSVPGVLVVGEVAGVPLIKLGLNQGKQMADRLAQELGTPLQVEGLFDVLVVGAGAAGLALAVRGKELQLRCVVVDAGVMASTVVNMYRGKVLFAEPEGVANQSALWFQECTREQLLERWGAQVKDLGLDVRERERVVDVQKQGEQFHVVTDRATYRARRVVLAVGKAGNPRKAGVPGEVEHAAKVLHALSDPAEVQGRRVLIYGGGDVACEAALALAPANDVTLVTLDQALVYPKKRNRDAVQTLAAEGKLRVHLASKLLGIGAHDVTFKDGADATQVLANDLVFEMIGADLPLSFFKKIGVALEGAWTARKWAALAVVSVLVYSLYALKKFPERPYSWPFYLFMDEQQFRSAIGAVFHVGFLPFRPIFTDVAWADIQRQLWFQQGYLYSLAYTVIMAVFGWQALKRWSATARSARYQRWRYASLVGFQVTFFLLANVIAVQGLSVQLAWRAWGLYQPWPLFFHTFHWWEASDPRAVLYTFVGAGLLGTFVFIPWLSHRHGKRFCTWICGCGGLAETLGDRWRHLAAKGPRSRAWEFQGAVILVAAALVTLVTVGMYGTRADNPWALAYSYTVDFWLVAVIPIALYPFFGGKVWCRYWCPLAAWNQILSRWYGKLAIQSNDKCISCGQCSKYCQVGVDVMAYAKNVETFSNQTTSCIHCGICIDVCPMDVLSFTQTDGRRALGSHPRLRILQ